MEPEDSAPLTAVVTSVWIQQNMEGSSSRPESVTGVESLVRAPGTPDSSAGSESLFPFSGLEVAGPLPFGR
ncbi:unnamed protein product [Boreogadus saida]